MDDKADRAARLLANTKMEAMSDRIRVLKKKTPMTQEVAIEIQKLERERKDIRDRFMKVVWVNDGSTKPGPCLPAGSDEQLPVLPTERESDNGS